MKATKPYFYQSLLAFLLATAVFFGFKSFLPSKLFPTPQKVTKNVVIDSLLLDAIEEEKTVKNTKVDTFEIEYITVQNPITGQDTIQVAKVFVDDDSYTGEEYLTAFFEKLFQLQTTQQGSVRIAYFSDSMTDGDMIVQDFRTFFQEKFGGRGVGFVNITSESAASRSSVWHTFSNNWKMQSYLKTKKPSSSFGVNGHVFFANDTVNDAWVKFTASKMRYLTQLPKPTLFYGSASNKEGKIYQIIGNDTIENKLSGTNRLNTLKLASGNIKSLKVYFETNNIPIYGFNFDDGKGVHVDNFSSRGNSGLPLSMFNTGLMQDFQKKLGYDLIVLHYGTNILNYGSYNYSWYEKRMKKVIVHLKKCFPNAEFLIVSTADKATKYGLEMKTDSAVVPLMKAQRKYAITSASGFVDLYQKMGGEGSMVKWVEADTAKANKDYTHFNYRGSKMIGKLIFDQLDEGFEKYKTERKSNPVQAIKTDSIEQKTEPINNVE